MKTTVLNALRARAGKPPIPAAPQTPRKDREAVAEVLAAKLGYTKNKEEK